MYASIVFDLDGTLIDSQAAILESLLFALNENNIKPLIPISSVKIGPPLNEILQQLSGVKDERLPPLVDSFKKNYDSKAHFSTKAYIGIQDLIIQLAGKTNIFVATNKRFIPTKAVLQHLTWLPLFKAVYCLDRPEPGFINKAEMLASLIKDQGLDSKKTLYVGDTLGDKDAAQKNGMTFYAAGWGYGDFLSTEPYLFTSVSMLSKALLS